MKTKTTKRVLTGIITGLVLELGVLSYIGLQRYNEQYIKQDSGIVAPRNYKDIELTTANRELLDFPTTINGIGSVRKYLNPKAKHVLVHLRQLHSNPKITLEQQIQVHCVQTQILNCLEDLQTKNYYSYYVEGHDLAKHAFYEKYSIPEYTYLKDNLLTSAADKLAKENKITLKIGEDAELNIWSEILNSDETKKKECAEVIYNKRELFVLDQIVKNKDTLGISIYGAGHCFGGVNSFGDSYEKGTRTEDNYDSISVWNNNHPEEQFSLIELTPKNYENITNDELVNAFTIWREYRKAHQY